MDCKNRLVNKACSCTNVARHILLGFYFTLPFWKQNVSKSLSESNNSQKQQFLISCSFICGFQRFSTSHVGLSGGIHISQWWTGNINYDSQFYFDCRKALQWRKKNIFDHIWTHFSFSFHTFPNQDFWFLIILFM